jgi:hypothetical protein
MPIPAGFYAYLYLRTDGTPYYAGKGFGKRAFQVPTHIVRPPRNKALIMMMSCRNEADALATEIELIRNWGRKDIGTGILRNLTDGGDGSSGYRHTEENRRKMSRSGKRKRLSEEHKRKIGLAQLGRKRPPETGSKIGAAMHLRKLSAESRKKISDSLKDHFINNPKVWSEESRNKNSESLKRFWRSKKLTNAI